MVYDAVILAGGRICEELRDAATYDNEAFIIIAGQPMILYVYKALRQSEHIRRIVISGPREELLKITPEDELLLLVSSGENAVESLSNAVHLLQEDGISESILIMPTDIPFISREAIEDFIKQAESMNGDLFYALTRKEINERKFPGVLRTYVQLKEGVFTGGNLFLMRSGMIEPALDMAIQLTMRRKNPLAMGRLFGFRMVLSYLLKRLSIPMVEKRFYEVMGIRGRGIISDFAEVGVDVDKLSDLELAQKYLSSS
ncbi:MAG: NTP transferase domain-containing protein [Syntrophomonadaceae bacterium]|jgi:GTP:adenosylcobinamide-phosphate guanylyltransferase|nr:NTP transferase domain-containing protein [Syntrophomonadaceae bacterium]